MIARMNSWHPRRPQRLFPPPPGGVPSVAIAEVDPSPPESSHEDLLDVGPYGGRWREGGAVRVRRHQEGCDRSALKFRADAKAGDARFHERKRRSRVQEHRRVQGLLAICAATVVRDRTGEARTGLSRVGADHRAVSRKRSWADWPRSDAAVVPVIISAESGLAEYLCCPALNRGLDPDLYVPSIALVALADDANREAWTAKVDAGLSDHEATFARASKLRAELKLPLTWEKAARGLSLDFLKL